MKLTPEQRRSKIYELAETNEEYHKIMQELSSAKKAFESYTDSLPEDQRNLLWSYPGMGYFMHHRLFTWICETMRFPEEE